jgi:hypothetical protein
MWGSDVLGRRRREPGPSSFKLGMVELRISSKSMWDIVEDGRGSCSVLFLRGGGTLLRGSSEAFMYIRTRKHATYVRRDSGSSYTSLLGSPGDFEYNKGGTCLPNKPPKPYLPLLSFGVSRIRGLNSQFSMFCTRTGDCIYRRAMEEQ